MTTIMIVDDDADIRQSVKDLFENNDMSVMQAESADACLEQCKKKEPDLILLDIMMPGMPVQMLIPKIKHIKIIFLSALHYTQAEQFGITSYPNIKGFIQKPFDITDIVTKVKNALKN